LAAARVRFVPGTREAIAGLGTDQLLGASMPEAFAGFLETTTASDGTYAMDLPREDGSGLALAFRTGYTAARSWVSLDEKNEGEIVREFTLELGGSVTGRVTDHANGAPAAGMEVLALLVPPGEMERPGGMAGAMALMDAEGPSARVREDGSYALLGLAAGEYRIVPRSGESDYVGLSPPLGRKLAIAPGETDHSGIDFEVTRGAAIRGRVLSPEGDGVAGATIAAIPADLISGFLTEAAETMDDIARHNTRSGENGGFALHALPPGGKYLLVAKDDRYAPALSQEIAIPTPARDITMDLRLTAGATVRGTVRREDGSPVPGASVRMLPQLGDLLSGGLGALAGGDSLTTTSDPSGNFAFTRVSAGKYTVHASETKPGDVDAAASMSLNPWAPSSGVVEVDGTSEVSGVEVVLVEREGELLGVVVDDQGRPLPGVEVQATCIETDFTKILNAKTNEAGGFSFSGFETRAVRLRAQKRGYAAAIVENVSGNARDVVVRLDRAATVSGIVRTPDGAPATPPFKVAASPIREKKEGFDLSQFIPNLQETVEWVSGRDDGTFTIENAPTGEVEILAEVPGCSPGRTAPLQLAPGQVVEGIEIFASAGARLAGRVVDENGAPVSGAKVTLAKKTGSASEDMLQQMMPTLAGGGEGTATDSSGHYEFAGLEAATFDVTASHAEYAPSEPATVELAPGQAAVAPDLILLRGACVTGTVTELDEPKAGVLVQIVGPSPLKMDTTKASGKFRLDGLRPGDYLITATDIAAMQSGGTMRFKTRTVVLQPGETVDVEIKFGGGIRVFGKVEGLEPNRMYMVVVRRPGGPGPEEYDPTDFKKGMEAARYQVAISLVKPDGGYEMDGIDPGEYILEVLALPQNMMDLEAYSKMDRTPPYRVTIQLEDPVIEHPIRLQ